MEEDFTKMVWIFPPIFFPFLSFPFFFNLFFNISVNADWVVYTDTVLESSGATVPVWFQNCPGATTGTKGDNEVFFPSQPSHIFPKLIPNDRLHWKFMLMGSSEILLLLLHHMVLFLIQGL